MSSKFKRQQRKKRWSENGTVFPERYIKEISILCADATPELSAFAESLKELTTQETTYNEIPQLTKITSRLSKLWGEKKDANKACGDPFVHGKSNIFVTVLTSIFIQLTYFLLFLLSALKLYVELVFLENSKPLHRSIVASLSKMTDEKDLIAETFYNLCKEYGRNGPKHHRFALVGVGSTLTASQFQVPLLFPTCWSFRSWSSG